MKKENLRQLSLDILIDGCQKFDAMLGIVSRIKNSTYEIYAVSTDTGIPEVGDSYPLTAVYCREVFECKKTVAITEIKGVPGLRLHPLYDGIPCEFYISSPILVDGEVWGTLNFTSLTERENPFSEEEISYNEANARKISEAVTAGKA